MTDITSTDWTPQDEGNISASPNGSQGGFAPNTIPPTIRAIRGAVKRAHNKINAILTTTGTATALVLTHTVAPAALVKGERYAFFSSQTNTGAMTLAVNNLGAKSILQQDGTALKAGQIVAGSAICVIYDGTAFRLENYASNPKFSGTLSVDTIAATTITATNVTATLAGSGAAVTALNASQLTTGTLPNARISGAYDGITTLGQTGRHTITGSGEAIRIVAADATGDPYLTFYKTIDAVETRQGYVQHNDGVAAMGGFCLINDRAAVEGSGINGLIVKNAGGVDGLSHRVGGSYFDVWTKGNLPTPVVQATQIVAGNGLSGGGTLAASRTVTLGTPGTITNATTNSVSATSHTHELIITASDISGALGFAPLNAATTAQALAGTLTNVAMTPATTKAVVDANIPVVTRYQEFLSNGTWTKPAGLNSTALVMIELWGGGGGGGGHVNTGGGGGGGAYATYTFNASDVPASVPVVIGNGGAPGTPGGTGGTTSFGTLAYAYGGGGSTSGQNSSTGGGGGGGGGLISAGLEGGRNGTAGAGGGPIFVAGVISSSGGYGANGNSADGFWGGGGGSYGFSNVGGNSVYGGAGGGSSTGGISIYGGNGGGVGEVGTVPGGGGGKSASGAKGKAIVRVIG